VPITFGNHSGADGAPYTYQLTFVQVPRGVAWHAVIHVDELFWATRSGCVDGASLGSANLDEQLRAAVTRAIELGLTEYN
jgi:hypothetical protein